MLFRSREDFLEYAWKWTSEYGGIILDQLKMLGCSCDWKRTKFTLDDKMSDSVIKVFIDLYNKGLIYRGYRMLNWDPNAQTTLSEEEVLYEEREAKIYHIAYKLYDSEEKIIIATTRPETREKSDQRQENNQTRDKRKIRPETRE